MKLKVTSTLGMALALANAAHAAFSYSPLPLAPSSFNEDVVVENTLPALGNNSSATTDGGTNNNGNGWYEIGYGGSAGGSGLPAAGSTFTSVTFADHSYTMAPDYTKPNAILIDTGVTNGTLTLVTPAVYTNLSFLVTSGNGGGTIAYTVHHADNSTDTGTFGAGDWFGGSNPAFITFGRIAVQSGTFDGQGSITSPGNPRLYGRDITISSSSPVTSIDFKYAGGGANVHNQIYAVSGGTGGNVVPIAVTGYNYDLIVEAAGVVAGPANGTTQSLDADDNTGNSWYEKGYYAFTNYVQSGLPAHGSTLTNAAGDHIFQMPPDYTTSDAMYLNVAADTSLTATLASNVAPVYALSFLQSSGNGPRTIQVVVNHLDGKSETNSFTSLDWFNGGPTTIYGTSGRVAVDTMALNNVPAPYQSNQAPFLYSADIALTDPQSPITTIELSCTNLAGRTAIFAISGSSTPPTPLFSVQPVGAQLFPGAGVDYTFTANAAAADAAITFQWEKGTNGVYVPLANGLTPAGSTIVGATTTNLTINDITLADWADYVCVATDVSGSSTSQVATLLVLSPLQDVAAAGDPITLFQGSAPAAENVDHAIDHLVGADPGKYLNFGLNGGQPFLGPIGFITTPSLGSTIVTGMRIYTANDTQGRDPADAELYGSSDGGATYTLIYSNILTLPAGRNATDSTPIDPTVDFLQQLLFTNTTAYTTYKWTVTHVVSDSANNSMQVGEIELLGVADTSGKPTISGIPPQTQYQGSSATFTATVTGNPAPTLQWQAGVNGNYTNLTDGGNISGSTTTTLTINNLGFTNALDYRLVAQNGGGTASSAPAHLAVLSTLTDVTSPSDTITEYNTPYPAPQQNAAATIPQNAIDDFTLPAYINVGNGLSAGAGFAPFVGPVGLVITPALGTTLVTGLRIYTSDGAVISDPTDYTLQGSIDGTNFTTISSGPLSLPTTRNISASLDPLSDPLEEVLFPNSTAYLTYRIIFNHVVDDANATSLEIGELELLGVQSVLSPKLTLTTGGPGGALTITSTEDGTLQSTTTLNGAATVWSNVQAITANTPVTITPSPSNPSVFYRLSVP